MFVDYHTHCDSSFDSIAPMASMIQASIDMGMDHFCLTDHLDFDVRFSRLCGSLDPLAYNRLQAKEIARFPQADVRRGIEVGVQPHLMDTIRDRLAGCEFDFVIASLHYIGGQDPYFPDFYEGLCNIDVYTAYLQGLMDSLTGFDDYSVVGHIGYPSRFVPSGERYMKYDDLRDVSDELLRLVIQTGHGIEVNTSSYKTHGAPVPGFDYVRRFCELGGEVVTVGSDAHRPEDMGRYFTEAVEGIREAGFRYLSAFKGGQPEFFRI